MLYGYARVSTSGQATNGNSLEGQKRELIQRGVKAGDIYEDVYTGTKGDRPELSKLLERIEPGDTFMVCKLDRIARSVKEGLKLIDGLMTRGIAVHVLNIGLMDNTPNGKLMRNIFLAFAEFERDMIVSRTQEGKAIAKQKDGWREGRKPIYKPQQLKDAVKALETHSYKQVEEMYGISKSTLQRAKRADAKGELDGEGGI